MEALARFATADSLDFQAIYHVMKRDSRREPIFHKENRVLFLETLDEACQKTDQRGLFMNHNLAGISTV